MSSARRWLAAVPLMVSLFFAGAEAFRAAATEEALARLSRTYFALPLNSVIPRQQWDALMRELDEVESAQPRNPGVHELKGLLSVRRFDAPEIAASAASHFSRAISLRPVSAATWANLAEAKYAQGDTSATFERALATAASLGPFQPQVQRLVSHYGLAVWDEVSAATQVAIDGLLAAGMRRNPLEMLRIAERRGRLPIACRHLAGAPRTPDSKWSQLCPSREATR